MGEAAEMMLEGFVCEGCGDPFDDVIESGEAPGYPRRCLSCSDVSPRTRRSIRRVVGRERQLARQDRERREAARLRKPFECPSCGKLCKTEKGLGWHKRDKHGEGGR